MQTKYIIIGELRLAYIEKNPQSQQTVFFIHGNSGSSRTWRKQFEADYFSQYRLIAFDLPGTGQSIINSTISWDYSPITTGRILAEAVRQLSQNKPFSLVGFSYGTNVVAEMLNYSLTPVGIVLCAACVIGGDYTLDKVFAPGDSIFFHDTVDKNDVKAFFLSALVSPNVEDIEINTEDFLLAKPPFRTALIQSVVGGKVSDEIALLAKQDIPLQIFFGLDDKMLQIHYLDNAPLNIWRNDVIKLPGAGHYLQSDQPESFNQLLIQYLKESFSKVH
jgi:pimeloyl-ACP methyl ester carboxylesterase